MAAVSITWLRIFGFGGSGDGRFSDIGPKGKADGAQDRADFAGDGRAHGDRAIVAFTCLDPSQWKSARTTNATERKNEAFRTRIRTETVLPCAETVLHWILLASGQICKRKVDGWTLSQPIEPFALDRVA